MDVQNSKELYVLNKISILFEASSILGNFVRFVLMTENRTVEMTTN